MKEFLLRMVVRLLRFVTCLILLGLSAAAILGAWFYGGALAMVGVGVIAIVFVFAPAWKTVPALKLATTTFLGMRTRRALGEGPCLVVPWLEKVVLFDHEVQTLPITINVFCADGLMLLTRGLLRWQIDPALLSDKFMHNAERIKEILESAVLNEFGVISGSYGAIELKRSWEAVRNLVNSCLRTGTAPHIAAGIPPGERLKFYGGQIFRQKLKPEHSLDEERSEIENTVGVNIISFTLEPPRFTDTTGEMMESEGRAILKAKRDRVVAETKREIMQKAKEDGLTPADANSSAEMSMDQNVRRRIYDIDGLDRLRPFLKPPEAHNYGGGLCLRN